MLRTLYLNLSRITITLFGPKRLKAAAELLFWYYKHALERGLHHRHYRYFFTDYFELADSDYAGRRILDIGCGPRGSLEWADMAAERIGLDPLADRYRRLGTRRHNMTYISAPAEAIPFPDGYFDTVSTFNSLDHTDDLEQSIREIARVTKPGGRLLFIAELHEQSTVCEPSAFGEDIINRLKTHYNLRRKRLYEHAGGVYTSIRAARPYDRNNPRIRYAVLTLLMHRK